MKRSRLLGFLSLILFVAACAAPTVGHFDINGKQAQQPVGLIALLLGWIPPIIIPWSANLMLVAGWILYRARKFRAAFRLGEAATLTALTTWSFLGRDDLRIGYYLWQASFLAFALSAHAARAETSRE